ncbi:MAG: transglutaminase family protein [archaeon GB-1867-005]|nr:transglutaminase family protein [Candidatus Culexmicrobium cathedralense]
MEKRVRTIGIIIILLFTFSILFNSITVFGSSEKTEFIGGYVYYIIHAETKAEDINDYLIFPLPINYTDSLMRQEVHLEKLDGDLEILEEEGLIFLGLQLNKTGGAKGTAFVTIYVAYNWSVITEGNDKYIRPTVPSLSDYASKDNIPKELIEKYVKEPDEAIKSIESELDSYLKKHNVNMNNVIEVVYWTAKYIMENFEYEPKGKPRLLGEVIATRKGDCDDLSELFINLMWKYGIPAQLERVGIYLSGEYTEIPLGISKIIYRNVAYHGYGIVYIPGWGWIPVDITFNEADNPFFSSRYITGSVVLFDRVLERNVTVFEEFESFMTNYKTIIEEAYYDERYPAEIRWKELIGEAEEQTPLPTPSEGKPVVEPVYVVTPSNIEGEPYMEVKVACERMGQYIGIMALVFIGLSSITPIVTWRLFKKLEKEIMKKLEELSIEKSEKASVEVETHEEVQS